MAGIADAPLAFLHIPKTGGTSLIAYLDRQFASARICPAQLWPEWFALGDAPNFAFYRGHFGGYGLERIARVHARCVTVLRDPVHLARSTFGFLQREREARFEQMPGQPLERIERFLDTPGCADVLADKQCAFLSWDPQLDDCAERVFHSQRTLDALEPFRTGVTVDSQTRFLRAFARLEQCEWFGITEAFDEAVRTLAWQYRFAPDTQLEALRRSQTSGHGRVSSSLIERIESANVWDRCLYALASERFEARCLQMRESLCDVLGLPRSEAMGLTVERELEALDLLYRESSRPQWPSSLDSWRYGFDLPLPGSGWQRREDKHPEGDSFRWTGPGTTSWIDLPNPGQGTALLRLRVVDAVSRRQFDAFRLFANDVELTWRVCEGDLPVATLESLVPLEALGADPHRLRVRIELAQSMVPSEREPEREDSRHLGIAVHWFELRKIVAA